MPNRIDYDAAQQRLEPDPDILNSLMRLRKADKSVHNALAAFRDAGLSLDYILHGTGKPALPRKG